MNAAHKQCELSACISVAVCMPSCGCRFWRPVREIRPGTEPEGLALRPPMVVVVSCGVLGWCLAFTQPQRPGLAARDDLGLWWWRWAEGVGRGSVAASLNMNTCGAALGFFTDESCWLVWRGPLDTVVYLTVRLRLVTPEARLLPCS